MRDGASLWPPDVLPLVDRRKKGDTMKTCESCGGEMAKAREIERGLQLVGLALFVLGVALLFLFPAGTIIGGALIFGVLALGYSQKKIWKCRGCGHSLARV